MGGGDGEGAHVRRGSGNFWSLFSGCFMYESKFILAATQTCAAVEQRVLALVLEDIECVPRESETLRLVEESGNINGISGTETNN